MRHTPGVIGDLLWIAVPVAACAGMLWLANRIEPHWVAKNGRRFLTTAQVADRHGQTLERRHEVRVDVLPDGTLALSRRSVVRRDRTQRFSVISRVPDPPRRKAVFVLDAIPSAGGETYLLLRLPARSEAVPVLDALIDATD